MLNQSCYFLAEETASKNEWFGKRYCMSSNNANCSQNGKNFQAGEGGFGVVYCAKMRGTDVAVKMMKYTPFLDMEADIEDFKQEAYLMTCLRHPNVVLTLGLVLTSFAEADEHIASHLGPDLAYRSGNGGTGVVGAATQKTLCIITEWCENGSLWDVLQGDQGDAHRRAAETEAKQQGEDDDLRVPKKSSSGGGGAGGEVLEDMLAEQVMKAMKHHPLRRFSRVIGCALDAAR
eukprot:g5740.t1